MENLDRDNPQTSATPKAPEEQPEFHVVDPNEPLLKRVWEDLEKMSSRDRLALLYRLFPPGKTNLKVEKPSTRGRQQTLAEQIAEQHGMSVEKAKKDLDDFGF